MAVTDKSSLIKYIKRQLGSPVIHIEIAQSQIEDVIDDALDLFREYHIDALKQKWVSLNVVTGTQAYTLPDNVFAIVDVFGENIWGSYAPGDGEDEGYLMKGAYVGNFGLFGDDYSAVDIEVVRQRYAMYRAELGRDYLFNYSYLEREISFTSDILQNETLAILTQSYLDDSDKNFSSYWFKRMCVAMTGLAWANNVGKYSGASLPGGAQINYSDIFSKYDALRIELEEQIIDRYSDTFGIMIG